MAITPLSSTPTSTSATLLDERSTVSESEQPSSKSASSASGKAESDRATFSTRAERLAALNKEFTITGPAFEVSTAFIVRLQELEFISTGEAERLLGQAATHSKANSTNQESGAQAIVELQQDMRTLSQKAPEEGQLTGLFTETADALAELKASSPLANAPKYRSLQQRLEQALANNPDAASLSDAERRRMTQAMDVMLIASRLAPGSETNAGIRSYLANT